MEPTPASPRTRFVRFGLVGLSGVVVNLAALHLFAEVLGWHRILASALAIEVSIVSNFLLNNAWTFSDRNAGAAVSPIVRGARYNLVALIGMGIQLAGFEAANQAVLVATGTDDPGPFIYPAQIFGIALAMGWNFVSNLRWTWAQTEADSHD